jgi:hypothetical protein
MTASPTDNTPTPVHPKVQNATISGGAAGALTIIVVWALSLKNVIVPTEVALSFSTIFSAAATLAGGYFTPNPPELSGPGPVKAP